MSCTPALNRDCLINIFKNLSMNEKLKCRLVCRSWKSSIDKMIVGQQYLEIYAVNSSIAIEAIKATGVEDPPPPPPYSSFDKSLESVFGAFKNYWSKVNRKFSPQSSTVEHGYSVHHFENRPLEPLQVITSTSLMNILSTHYWTYAFCASSSLFSSYSFAISSLTTHEFFHSFCDCLGKQRYKYSVILDRHNITFEMLNTLLHKFSNVNCLAIHNVDQLSDVLFFMITQHCPKVKSLNFTNCVGLDKSAAVVDGRNHDNHHPHSPLIGLTDYAWRLLSGAYPNLASLTLRQCKLNEEQLTNVIKNCSKLVFLDISDNLSVGRSVRHLGPEIECLICGNLFNDESIETMLWNISMGNGKNLRNLAMFGALGSLKAFKRFEKLTDLKLHFYVEEDSMSAFLSDLAVLSLNSLVLEQIRCYESPSALNPVQFEAMLERSKNLQCLQITGDFDWNLRINDNSLKTLSILCPKLKELTLNGNGSLTDYGLLHLSATPLVQLNLASFYSITDYSIGTLLKQIPTLNHVTLVDMPQVSGRIITKVISICTTAKERTIEMTFSDEQIGRFIKKNQDVFRYPPNLKINYDTHLCGKQTADSEPTDFQIILVILMSAIILSMTFITTVVVVLVPLSMLLLMVHEYLVEVYFSNITVPEFPDHLNLWKDSAWEIFLDHDIMIFSDFSTITTFFWNIFLLCK